MISSFWNLCRACPSMPVEKLHSEYRSTFQWHEYVGSHNDSVTQPPVVRQPSQSHPNQLSTLAGPEEQSIPRRKKHPELANRSSNGWLTKSSTAYEASLCPDSRFTNISGTGGSGGGGGPRKSMSMGTIRSSGNIAPIHSQKLSLMPEYSRSAVADDTSAGSGMTTSAPGASSHFTENPGGGGGGGGSGGGAGGSGEQGALRDFVPSHSAAEVKLHISKEKLSTDGAPEQRNFDEFKKKEYKSEYKKRFRPFSQYEYVDGKFFKKKGDQEIGNPWYKEVIELRKKAGEYKFRGWGTELGPQNIAQVYHQHVWDQVSRRTSLAALALITTTPKSISKEEKDKENARKSYPGKPTHARPHTATPKHPISDLEKSKHFKDSDAVQPSKKKLLEENRIQNKSTSRVKEMKTTTPRPPSHKPTSTLLETKTNKLLREARSHSAGPAGRSPRKTIRQQSAASSASEKDSSCSTGGWKIHLDSSQVNNAPKPQQRHPRPTTLATSPRPKASSGKGDRDSNSKLAKQQQFDKNSADPYLGYNEPVIKSPPEPTRVKSPEQVILRSPDPVNWTVPLDTTKSFTVTQNIREAPPSPRFRAGEKLHGDIRNIHHPTSTHHSSAASTMASSPISSFSSRSAPVPLSVSSGQSGAAATIPTKSTAAAPATTTGSAGWIGGGTMTGKGSNVMSTGVGGKDVDSSGSGGGTDGSSGGGGGGGFGKPSTAEISGAGPGSGDGISASKPKQSTTSTKLEPKVSPQTQSATHHTVNGHGLEEKSENTPPSKSLASLSKDKIVSTSAKSSPQPRMIIGAVRSKETAKVHSSSTATASTASTVASTVSSKPVISSGASATSKPTSSPAGSTTHSKVAGSSATTATPSKVSATSATVTTPSKVSESSGTVTTQSKTTASPAAAVSQSKTTLSSVSLATTASKTSVSPTPPATVSKTSATPPSPATTLSKTSATPSSPATTLSKTSATPSSPATTLSKTSATPSPATTLSKTSATPSSPATTLSKTSATPSSPATTLSKTSATPSSPATTLSKLSASPPSPATSMSKISATPSSPATTHTATATTPSKMSASVASPAIMPSKLPASPPATISSKVTTSPLPATSAPTSKTAVSSSTASTMPLKSTASPPAVPVATHVPTTTLDKIRPMSASTREIREVRESPPSSMLSSTSAATSQPSAIPVARTTKQSPSTSIIIGSGLKCLEDPTFMFDPPKVAPATTSPATMAMSTSVTTALPSSKLADSPASKSMTSSVFKKLPEPSVKSTVGTGSKLPQPSKQQQPQPQQPLISTVSGKLSESSIPTLKSMPSTVAPSRLPGPELPKSVPTAMISSTMASGPELIKSIPTVASKLPGPVSIEPGKFTTSNVSGTSLSKFPESSSKPVPTFQSKIPEPSKISSMSTKIQEEPLTTSMIQGSAMSASGIKPPSNLNQQAKSSFRVLEAPPTAIPSPPILSSDLLSSSSLKRKDLGSFTPPAPVSAPKRVIGGVSHVSETPPASKGSSGYRVLEAPDDTDEPSVSVISPSSGRSRASDVLEKARHRFDKFWGKSKDDEK